MERNDAARTIGRNQRAVTRQTMAMGNGSAADWSGGHASGESGSRKGDPDKGDPDMPPVGAAEGAVQGAAEGDEPIGGMQIAALAREVHATRRRRLLSLEQLAAVSGVSRSMISKIERGEAVPSTTVLAKLAEALGVTFARLMSHPVEREVLVIEAARQPVLADAASGLVRRCLEPMEAAGLRPASPVPTAVAWRNTSTCRRERWRRRSAATSSPCAPATRCISRPMPRTPSQTSARASACTSSSSTRRASTAEAPQPPRERGRLGQVAPPAPDAYIGSGSHEVATL